MRDDQTPINAKPKRRLPGALDSAGLLFEEQVLWRAADAGRAAAERARRVLEAVGWALRRWLLWPLQDRLPLLDRPGAGIAAGAAALLIAGVAATALVLSLSDSEGAPVAQPLATVEAPAPEPAPAPVAAAPTLRGVAPEFEPAKVKRQRAAADNETSAPQAVEHREGRRDDAPVSSTADEPISSSPAKSAARASAASASSSAAAASGPAAGPAALAVARRFADAFVVYETGGAKAPVRKALSKTATGELSRSLLERPPRLPANIEVPRAKVVNVVAAPSRGGIYPVSVSLLRVGSTSELRLDLQKIKGDGWRVTNVLG